MGIIILFVLGFLSGLILFRKNLIPNGGGSSPADGRLSVIIPARNEEENLPHILSSLQAQTVKPYEIIVVDDFSEDRTKETAVLYGVKVVENPELPAGWTGKTWAVWNGFLNSSGDILAFLDADVRLAPNALELLMKAREKSGGVISVVPYHHTEKFYERLSLVANILGTLTFTSLFEKKNPRKGLYGSCIITTREDYEKINGHSSIKGELLDDLNLGAKYVHAGIAVNNYIGGSLVSFRMYPHGIRSEMEGFGKGAVLSTSTLSPRSILFIAIWVIGLMVSGFVAPVLLLANIRLSIPFLLGYALYVLQICYFIRYVGHFGKVVPVLYFIPALFFISVMLYSAFQVTFLGHVAWKGRYIEVGGKKSI